MKNFYNNSLKIRVITEYQTEQISISNLANKYNIHYENVRKWIRSAKTIFEKAKEAKQNRSLTKFNKQFKIKTNHRSQLGRDLETKIDEWIVVQRAEGIAVSNAMIQEKARNIARNNGIESFKASNGWIEKFKRRFNWVMRKPTQTKKRTVEQKSTLIDSFKEELNNKPETFFFK